jgi:general secretion pathway protein A
MYLDFFGLSKKPFNVTPDPRFLYLTPSHREALASLIYGIRERMGIVCLIGEVGTGKTTLLYKLIELLDEDIRAAYIFNSKVTFKELLRSTFSQFGPPASGRAHSPSSKSWATS